MVPWMLLEFTEIFCVWIEVKGNIFVPLLMLHIWRKVPGPGAVFRAVLSREPCRNPLREQAFIYLIAELGIKGLIFFTRSGSCERSVRAFLWFLMSSGVGVCPPHAGDNEELKAELCHVPLTRFYLCLSEYVGFELWLTIWTIQEATMALPSDGWAMSCVVRVH